MSVVQGQLLECTEQMALLPHSGARSKAKPIPPRSPPPKAKAKSTTRKDVSVELQSLDQHTKNKGAEALHEEAPTQQDVMWACDRVLRPTLSLTVHAVNGKGQSEALCFELPWTSAFPWLRGVGSLICSRCFRSSVALSAVARPAKFQLHALRAAHFSPQL
eukprot:Skav200588  [mRNA]  locus=scaffold1051:209878:220924:- [translate_table: standard]